MSNHEADSALTFESLQPCRRLTFLEIQLATRNFDESLVIGHGGFGKVYKGTITNGKSYSFVAIKRLDSTSNQGEMEFWSEVETLSKLRHCHLVSLIGYCNDMQEMILVYEYMLHGTLADHLHKHQTPLSWVQRLNICIGTARGLDYLHTGTGISHGVIHRDVKSSNILLQNNWAAKISDFGLSRIGPTNQPSTYVNTLVKGTFGYLDPDYFSTGHLTRKSDVYAFGVVLFETLCGKQAVDKSLDEDQWGLAGWAQDSIKEGRIRQIIDSNMGGDISNKCLKDFGCLANRCLQSHPKHRPTMAQVVAGLEAILALQEKTDSAISQPSRMTKIGRKVLNYLFPSSAGNSGIVDMDVERLRFNQDDNVVNSIYLLSSTSPSSCGPEANDSEEDGQDGYVSDDEYYDANMPLPTIESLQISGEAFPGHEVQACGFAQNGTTHCLFKWVRYSQDGSAMDIEGARSPVYIVTADDIDSYLVIQVQPIDARSRKGELVNCFANHHQKIIYHPEMLLEIEKNLSVGYASFKLSVWKAPFGVWEPATLEIKSSSYRIKLNQPIIGNVLVNDKYTPTTNINVSIAKPLEFSISSCGGFYHYLQIDCDSSPHVRDTIVVTMRMFIERATRPL